MKGIDVSAYQGTVNWGSVANAGISFAYVKATEGTGYYSSTFTQQYQGAKGAGLYAGAYAFGRPDSPDPVAQADYLIANAQYANDGRTLPLMLDLEWPYFSGISSCWGLSAGQMVSWIRSFVNEVKLKTGKPALIYTNPNWWNPCTGNSAAFSDQWLNISYWASGTPSTLPSGWSNWTVWQYADSGSQPGDQDVFQGDRNALARFAAPTSAAGTAVPTATSGAPGAIDTFFTGFDGTLWQTSYRSGWSVSSSILPVQLGGNPVAVEQSSGTIDVFWRGTDSALWHAWYVGGQWNGPESFGSSVSGDPSAVVSPAGIVDVFWRDLGGNLVTKRYSSAWSAPSVVPVGVIGSAPSAAVTANSTVDVFWRGATSGLWTISRTTSGWSSLVSIAPSLQGVPAVATSSPQVDDVFFRGNDGGLWHSWRVGGRWYGPGPLPGGALGSDPIAVGQSNSVIDVFWRGQNGALWHEYYVSGWHGPESLGGSMYTKPAAVVQSSGIVDVFYNNSVRGLGHSWYINGWYGPQNLGGFLA